MKTLFLFVLLLQGSLLSFAQTAEIKGQIQDRLNGQGFPFVDVMVEGATDGELRGTSSDSSGYFHLKELPPGTYDIRLRFVGYPDTLLQAIKVAPDTLLNLQISYPPYCHPVPKDKTCPFCHKQDEVVPVIYGMPSKKLMRKERRGKLFSAGCIVPFCSFDWYCKRDGTQF